MNTVWVGGFIGKKNYRLSKAHTNRETQELFREVEDHFIAKDKDGNIVIDRDVRCRSLYVEGESIYVGGIKMKSPIHSDKDGYWKYNREIKEFDFTAEARPEPHAERHEVGGDDLVNHDDLTGFVGDEHIPMATVTVDIPIALSMYDGLPERNTDYNVHGGLIPLDIGSALGPTTPGDDITVSKGIGKIVIVVNAGSDLAGDITITGDTVDRDTGAISVADTDTITVDALTTDNTTTDLNGHDVYEFIGAYITSKWFTGTVVLSSTTLTLSDVDTYHVSFEQWNDLSDITINTFDANIFTTNANAEFDAYLHTLHVTGDKCNIDNEAELHVGADGETAIANKYWRLRKGNINESIDGTTDGFWFVLHYANNPVYVEDVTVKVWATKSQVLTY